MLFDKPLAVWLGMLLGVLLFATAFVGFAVYKRLVKLPFALHMYLAAATLIVGIVHGILGLLLFF